MNSDLEKLIDGVWNLSLDRVAKKEVPVARPSLGDDIDLCIPQTRTLLMLEANPAFASVIYSSAYVSTNRNAYAIMRKLGMPADYFWKFEYWMKQRALETLGKVINRVFTAMMKINREGNLSLEDVDVENVRFTLSFNDCVECAGIKTGLGICYYHAGTFAGIVAALLSKDMDGIEINCHATGGDACVFLIGKRDDQEIIDRVNDYLSPSKIETKIDDSLNSCLQGNPVRSMGNKVNISYYDLMVINGIISDPNLLFSSSFEVGVEHGKRLASMITGFYHENQLGVIGKYYNQLRHLDVRAIEVEGNIDIVLTECAEITTIVKSKELLGFLFGELQGLVLTILNRKMAYKESWFDNNDLTVRLSPEG